MCMFKKIADIVVRFPWFFIVLFIAITMAFAYLIPRAQIDPDIIHEVPPDFPAKVNMDRIEDTFGGTEMIMVVIKTDDVLKPATLKRVKKISEKMNDLSQVDQVLSIFDVKDIEEKDGMMKVAPAVNVIPETPSGKKQLRQRLKDNEFVYGNVISRDFKATAVIGMLKIGVSDFEILDEVKKIISEVPGPESVEISGMPYVRAIVGNDMRHDLKLFTSIGLIIMLIFLYLCFRQTRGVILPFVVVVASIIMAFGIIALMGWKIHISTILLPVMLIAIANDYGIHLIAKYQYDNYPGNTLSSKDLARGTVESLGLPILFAAITTMAGMLCIMVNIVVTLKHLGLLAAIGIAYAFFGSITFIPAVMAVIPNAKPIVGLKNGSGKHHPLDRLMFFISGFVTKRPKAIIISAVIIAGVVSMGVFLIKVDTNPVNYYSSNAPVAKSVGIVNQYFGGNTTISVVAQGDIKDPSILRQIDKLELTLRRQPDVGTTVSIARVIKKMNKVMHDGNQAYYRIPDTRNAVAQYLLLYSMSGDPDDFDRMVDYPYRHAQIIARINTLSTGKIADIVEYTRDYIKEHKGSPFTVVGGFAALYDDMIGVIIKGQVQSLSLSLLVVAFLVALLFRSFVAGILASITLGLAISFLFGLMGFLGINLDLATAVLSSLMIGVGVDYTIHYMWHYKEERLSGKSPVEATRTTFTSVGRGIVFNALSVIIGFIVLLISAFLPVRFFGFLVVVTISACLVGALIVLPSLIIVLRPKFLESEPQVENNNGVQVFSQLAD